MRRYRQSLRRIFLVVFRKVVATKIVALHEECLDVPVAKALNRFQCPGKPLVVRQGRGIDRRVRAIERHDCKEVGMDGIQLRRGDSFS